MKSYNIKKINLFNLGMLGIFSVLTVAQSFIEGTENGLTVFMFIGISFVLSFISFLLPINRYVKGFLISTFPIISSIIMSINKPNVFILPIQIIIIAMLGMYFIPRLIVSFAILVDGLYLAALTLGRLFYPIDSDLLIVLIKGTIFINFAFIIVFFLSKWGAEYIHLAFDNMKKSDTLLGQNEILLNKVKDTVIRQIQKIKQGNQEITDIYQSSELNIASLHEVAAGIEESTKDVIEVSAKISNLSEAIEKISFENKEMSERVIGSQGLASKTAGIVSELEKSLDRANDNAQKSIENTRLLNETSETISNIVSIISSISAQTNLLALNASIEAARAGEQGKGFAVVADEVRKLSLQTNQAIDQIKETITSINQSIEKTSFSSNEIMSIIQETIQVFNGLKITFESIGSNQAHLARLINQSAGETGAFNQAFQTIKNAATNVSSVFEEVTATTETLTNNLIMEQTHINGLKTLLESTKNIGEELTEIQE